MVNLDAIAARQPAKNGGKKTRFVCSGSWFLTSVFLALSLCLCGEAFAQTTAQAEVALQGYYLAGSGQPLINTSGLAVSTTQLIPGVGLLTGSAEGYGSNGFRTGNMFLGLQGAPLLGWHWDFRGGDFQFSPYLVENPFLNIYTPEIEGRGFRVVMRREDRSYEFFVGEETLWGGPRIPLRILLPQRLLGGNMKQKVGKRWEFGLRYLNLSTNPSALVNFPNYFYTGHDYQSSNSITFQSSYSFTKHLKFYSEASYGKASAFPSSTVAEQAASGGQQAIPLPATPASQVPFSLLVGPSWETDKFSLKANYVRQSTTYLPLLGYFVGDRKGPYVEGHYRPVKRVGLYGSASEYSNNLEKNPQLPSFHSSQFAAGSSFLLPWKFNAGASLSFLDYTQRQPSRPAELASKNRQLNVNLNRPIKRHSLRLSLIDMKLNMNSLPQVQRFLEFEDIFTWKRLVIGGAVREQNSRVTETRNTLFFRGSLQTHFKRVSAYGYFEKGNDLVNRSIFSTNAYSSTVAGVSAPLLQGWRLHLEALRNRLNTALNPENIFLFPNSGLGLTTQLAAFNQWSVFFRISKQFYWGKELPRGTSIEEYAREQAPLVGSVQGLIKEQSLAGERPATNVAVSLDGMRWVVSDASGHYQFDDVPEGFHQVGLDMDRLPTDYEPGPAAQGTVRVEPRAIARADFNVVRLTFLAGRIVAPAGVPVESVVIRLVGRDRYTTPYVDGSFYFYNLREGEYQVMIDDQTLPEGCLLWSPGSVRVVASSAAPAVPIIFELRPKPPEEKPVREIFHEEIRVDPGGRHGDGAHGGP
jgi:hypothetical protein